MSNEIIESNSWLIYKIARSYSEYYNIEDLFQVGSIGLLKAYKNYDKNSNVKKPLKIEFIEKLKYRSLNSENLYDILLIVNIKSVDGDFMLL